MFISRKIRSGILDLPSYSPGDIQAHFSRIFNDHIVGKFCYFNDPPADEIISVIIVDEHYQFNVLEIVSHYLIPLYYHNYKGSFK
jgi:hypothetical protein